MSINIPQGVLDRYLGNTKGNNVNYSSNISDQIKASNNGNTGQSGTFSTSQVIDAICEGPIEGWPTNEPLKHIYLDGTPVQAYSGSFNSSSLRHEFRNGVADQSVLSQYTLIGAVKTPNFQDEILLNDSITQQIQIRDDSDGAYPPVEAVAFTFSFPEGIFRYKSSGGRDGTGLGFKIEVNNKADGTGTWVTRFNWVQNGIELTNSPFEWTFIVELPPGWTNPDIYQKYTNKVDDVILFRITKTLDDSSNDRAHSRMYLKNYAIYTRNQFTFPYTALVGMTIDSKNFDGSIPRRMYDLKLLKVKVPSNYNIVTEEKEGKIVERNYVGQWDGTFKDGYWTDNPVWCFYDLVTNERYGLGKYIDPSLLNKWKLYEIAKYCDAVVADTRSFYSDGVTAVPANSYTFSGNLGGVPAAALNSSIKEPRFTCNIFIASREEAYSVVQRMASLFRAIVFFQQGTLEVVQDRPATPTFLYNNTNVIDGIFSYSSSSTKARHTVAIVKWLDPDDLYSEKLEYVEDYDGIARYGYREIEIDGFGCTSRGQARRLGRHILITEKFELETLSFKVGMEGAVLTPGALIKVKDSYRQVYRASGRVLSATSSYVTIDKPINVPTGATNVTLWVQTANAQNEVIDTNTTPKLIPKLDSYSINVPAFSPAVSNLSPTTTLSPLPQNGNIWALSYTESGDVENTSVYRVLSVAENNNYEYEITALQHYSAKFDEIEAYAPIPQYKPAPLKLFTPPPSEGFLSSKFNGTRHDITISWRSDRYISGTQYRLEVLTSTKNKVIYSGTDTTFVYENIGSGIYSFNVYSINNITNTPSEPLVLGPLRIKEVMPQNNFDSFNQTQFSADYITNAWPDDVFPNDPIKYELWRANTNGLRTAVTLSPTIRSIDEATKKVTLNGFDQTLLTSSPDQYSVEVPIYPYIKYKAASPTSGPTTSPNMVVLSTVEKPNILVGDKLVNTTRRTTTNVSSITQSKNSQGRWITNISVAPAVSPSGAIGPQSEGDIVYLFKGVMGVQLNATQASGVIEQKTFKAAAGTTTSVIQAGSASIVSNIAVGDLVINRTRSRTGSLVQIVSPTSITISPIISGQTSGDVIAYYQSANREPKKLYKYSIDFITERFGGDSINVINYDNPDYIPTPNKSIMVNVTTGKAAEVIAAELKSNGILSVVTVPNHSPNMVDGNQVIFFDKNEVYTSSILTHIHPVSGIASGATSPAGVTCSSLFTSAVKGDILVNATRNTSAVVLSKISNNQVTLAASSNSALEVKNQAAGDVVFLVSGSSMTSFNEELSYNPPTVYTTTTGTTTSSVIVSPSIYTPSPTTSYILYNMTRNAYASVSPNTATRVTVSPTITGQTVGDKVYLFLPSTVSTTVVSAPDGAFTYARPGDIFYNLTRDDMATIKDVKTLSGNIDKKIDRLVLSTAIANQKAGDEFRIIQGFFNSAVKSKENNGSNDILELETVANLELGDEVRVYKYDATKVGTTAGNVITDTGLSPSTTYYYWMRPVSSRLPFLGGIWKPSRTTGDSATTLPTVDVGNYNFSNDNNANPISPYSVSPGGLSLVSTNEDSTSNISLNWDWIGKPSSIDGFIVYFWSSNSTTDSPLNSSEFTKSISTYDLKTNQKVGISNITYVGSAITVTTAGAHNLSSSTRVKIVGAKISTGSPMNFVNTEGDVSVFTITSTGTNTFTFTASGTPTGTYLANSGTMISCKYSYQVNNLTSNYYYNGWIQPYRVVNTTISENGILLGSPTLLA